MNKKVFIISLIILIIIAVIGYSTYFFMQNRQKNTPTEVLNEIANCIQNANYNEMYNLITAESKNKISEEQFIERNKNIYDGISMTNYKIEINSEIEQEDGSYLVDYNVHINSSLVDEINFNNTSKFIKNKETKKYELDWSSNFIFPSLDNTDKVRVKTIEAQRGKILDRNGEVLAGLGEVSSVRICS